MTFIKSKIQKISLRARILYAILGIVLVSGALVYINSDAPDAKGDTVISQNSKEYLSAILERMAEGVQKDFTILEIVPYQGVGEYRYYVGSAEVETGLLSKSKDELFDTFIKDYGYSFKYVEGLDKYDVEVTPLFQTNILTPNAALLLDGKIKVNTVEANKLTEEDVKKADLIVLTANASNNNALSAYNYIKGNIKNKEDVVDTGVYKYILGTDMTQLNTQQNGQISYETYEMVGSEYVSRDISWDMAKNILEVLSAGRDLKGDGSKFVTPVVISDKITDELAPQNTNMYKLATIIKMMDSSKYMDFVKNYTTTVDENGNPIMNAGIQTAGFCYTDTNGTYHVLESFINEQTGEFISEDIEKSGANSAVGCITTNPNNKSRVTNNYISHAGTQTIKNYYNKIDNGTYEGATAIGLENESFAEALRYLIGCKKTFTLPSLPTYMKKVRVLEIQPTNKVSDNIGSTIASNLGISSYDVEVTTVSTKELNCLTEDIIAAYDVVYIGVNDSILTKSSGKTVYNDRNLNGYVYLAFGDLVKGSSSLMGLFSWEYNLYTGATNNDFENDAARAYYDNFLKLGVNDGDWRSNNHTGLIKANKIPDSPRYSGTINFVGINYATRGGNDWGYNDQRPNQLKINYVYVCNENTKKMFNEHQQEFLYTEHNELYGIVDLVNYYKDRGYLNNDNASMDEFNKIKEGNCRLSDNDITAKTRDKLKEFAKSGKLIILANDVDDYNKNDKIYPTSHMYELVDYLTTTGMNCLRYSNISSISTRINVKAPILSIKSCPPALEYGTDNLIKMPTTVVNTLDFVFEIRGSAYQEYIINVIIDKNGDGRFDSNLVTDDNNEVVKTTTAGTDATGYAKVSISVPVPGNKIGVVPYKLEVVVPDATGAPTSLRSGLYGYTAVKSDKDPESIKVLQIMPTKQVDDFNGMNINLNMAYKLNAHGGLETYSNWEFAQALKAINSSIAGYQIEIKTMYTHEFEAKFQGHGKKYTLGASYDTDANYLIKEGYDMVIIGFADSFFMDDISNTHGAMDCINDFIANGNSVMFAHDTMSFCTTVNYAMLLENGKNLRRAEVDFVTDNDFSYGSRALKIAQSISQNLRNTVGLDRYGATLATSNREGKDKPVYASGKEMSYSKYGGNQVSSGKYYGKYYVEELHGFTDWNLYRQSLVGGFKNGSSNKFKLYLPYTDVYMNPTSDAYWETNARDLWLANKAVKVNSGQVTMFPYKINDEITIADTHAQWYQLDLEDEDVIVWYTLKSDEYNHYYNINNKDGRNQYYIYSKGSVTYTGAGHSSIGSNKDELKLFINTIIMTIEAANSEPEVFVTNGALGTGGIYYITADTYDEYTLKFKATDADLTSLEGSEGYLGATGRFKSGRVVWDKNGNGVIDYPDVVVESYGAYSTTGKELYNGVEVTLDIMDKLSGPNKTAMSNQMTSSGKLDFIIEATDSNNAIGTARAQINVKPLFDLD